MAKRPIAAAGLDGKVALITGADSGIGRAVAIAFAREGADVVIAYLSEHGDAEETAKWVREAGRKAVAVAGDVADEGHCNKLVAQTMESFGHLDILVNNAAMQRTYKTIEDIPAEEWDRTFKTNVYSQFYLSKAAVRVMRSGSSIVNTTSINAKNPSPSLLPYATTKGAIANFTAGLAQMLADRGIRVNFVAPGPSGRRLFHRQCPMRRSRPLAKTRRWAERDSPRNSRRLMSCWRRMKRVT